MSDIVANFTDGSLTISDDGGNSDTLPLSRGTLKISGIKPDGREAVVSESRGAVVSVRKGKRARPTLTIEAHLAAPSDTFHELALGVTAGFTSTVADIGDYAAVDMDFSFDYGAEARDITADDLILTSFDVSEGEESSVSMTFEILGPLEMDGDTIITSR